MFQSDNPVEREFTFDPTPAVATSRSHSRYVACPVCQVDNSRYLFHRVGVRFVRCQTCGMVYVNPVGEARLNYFDIERVHQYATPSDRALAIRSFERFLARVESDYERVEQKPLKHVLLLGRWLPEFAESLVARRVGLRIATADDTAFRNLALTGDLTWASSELDAKPELVILNELLEACSDAQPVLEELDKKLVRPSWLVVTYSNAESLPARFLKRTWSPFFDYKNAFFNTNNLQALMAHFGFEIVTQYRFPVTQTATHVLSRLAPENPIAKAVTATPLGKIAAPLRTGHHTATFRRGTETEAGKEKLSIVFPVYNEGRYVGQVIEKILAKKLKIDKELIIVESNSTDGTREVVSTFANREGVKILYEDKPQGKGHAVKTGLKAVTGSIVLIQDADFEYDIDDYDALLEPLLQRQTAFVLGSRSLGLDNWKVRKYANSAVKGFLLNFAQVVFAKTFNVLYQQHITDVNTMFKVFRSECLQGLDLECDGFNLDIELACKLVRNGNAPIEVPVNYVSRGFDEGKKIRFLRDALPSYWAFFRYRFED